MEIKNPTKVMPIFFDVSTIGGRLKFLRARKGVRAGDVSAAVGGVRQAYVAYETGVNVPGIGRVQDLADYFGVSPGWIAFGVGDVTAESEGGNVD